MRVISLVPSLTETLLECGVEVVGRTRFCVHPLQQIVAIPIIGGTKGVYWSRCVELKPDLVVMDREENQKAMADACPYPWHATHISSVDNVGGELCSLAEVLANSPLMELGNKWNELAALPNKEFTGLANMPGVLEMIGEPADACQSIEYIIWRDPWMAVGPDTFIASVLTKLGAARYLTNHTDRYPELDASAMADPKTFHLFSSEPYPFGKHIEQLRASGLKGALVDGECYSWFGIRSYRFLRTHLETLA